MDADTRPADGNDLIRVMIVDDHDMFAESLARLLSDESDIEVVGDAGTARQGEEVFRRVNPDVVLLDYRLPDMDGPVAARRILDEHPEAKIVMLTGYAAEDVLVEAIRAGCCGFVTKDRAAAEVVQAVRAASEGESLISPEMLTRLLPRFRDEKPRRLGFDLTGREKEVLDMLAKGSSNQLIADALTVSIHTVRNHVQNVITKLGAHSKLEAVAIAVREGLASHRPQ